MASSSCSFSAFFTSRLHHLATLHTAFAIIFSAATYLFDFATTMATAIEYHNMVQAQPSMVGIFIAILCLILVSHTVNAVVFKLELRQQDRPIFTAYLFPLLQFYRLVVVVWNECSWKRLKDLKSERKSTLFNLLAVALETAPQLALQFSIFLVKLAGGQTSKVLYVSLFASFLSGTVNGGIVMLSTITMSHKKSRRVKAGLFIVAGMFTLSVLILQCVTIIALIMWKGWISPVSFILLQLSMYGTLFYTVILSKDGPSARAAAGAGRGRRCRIKGKRVARSLSWAYISMTMGPLYPVTSNVKSRGDQRTYFLKLLILAAGFHLGFDVVVFVLSLSGPPFCRWSFYCVQVFKVPYEHFACSFYVPTSISAITAFIISIISYIYLIISNAIEADATREDVSVHSSSCSQNISDSPTGTVETTDIGQAPEFGIDIEEHQNQAFDHIKEDVNAGRMKLCNVMIQYTARPAANVIDQSTVTSFDPIDDHECLYIEGDNGQDDEGTVSGQCDQPCASRVDVAPTCENTFTFAEANMQHYTEKSTAEDGEIAQVDKPDDVQEKHIGYVDEARLHIQSTTSMKQLLPSSTEGIDDLVFHHNVDVEDKVIMETNNQAHKEQVNSSAGNEFVSWEPKINPQTDVGIEDSRLSYKDNSINTAVPVEIFNSLHPQDSDVCNSPTPSNQPQELIQEVLDKFPL